MRGLRHAGRFGKMAVTVRIPHLLRELTGGKQEVSIEAATVELALDILEERFPGMKQRIRAEDGSLRRYVNVYVNDEDVRFLSGLGTKLKDGDMVSILPMIAGG